MHQRFQSGLLCVLAGLVLAAASFAAAEAGTEVLVLSGLDNNLSVIDPVRNQTRTGAVSLPGFPSQAVVDKQFLYVVASGADQVLVYNKETLALSHVLDPGPGSNPYAVAVDRQGNAYVSLFLEGQVARFDPKGRETGRVVVGRSPEGLCVAGPRLYVAVSGFRFSDFGYDPGKVSVIDLARFDPVAEVPVGTNPQWPVVHGNEIHVICTGNYFSEFGEIHIFDARTLLPRGTVELGGSPGFLALDDDTGYASDYFGGITSYRISTREVLHGSGNPILVGGTGYSGLVSDGKGSLYVALFEDDAVARLRTSDNSLAGIYAGGDGPVVLTLRHVSQAEEPNRKAAPVISVRDADLASPGSFRIASQPARGAAVLVFENPPSAGLRMDLIDVLGRRVSEWNGTVSGSTVRWDVSGIAAGVYTLRAVDGNIRSTRRLVVVP